MAKGTIAFLKRPIFLTTLVALIAYWFTLAPDLTWSHFGVDGGELITAAVTLGIPHPPGYPTYTLLGKLISWLPLRTVAYRFNLFSAITTAMAAGLVSEISLHQLTRKQNNTDRLYWIATAVGLTFAFSALVWSQAVITEIYGLNLLCLAGFLWALLEKRPSRQTGLLLGLSITTHLTSIMMIPLSFLLTHRKLWFRLGQGVVVGLVPFLLLPWLAKSSSPIIWGKPDTLSGWWWLVSGQLYQANLFSITMPNVASRALEWVLVLANQFTWAGLPLIFYGFFRSSNQDFHLNMSLLATAVLYISYAFIYGASDAVVLLLPAILLMSLLLAKGIQQMGRFSLILPVALLLINYSSVDLSKELVVRPAATALLREAPNDAILLTPGDQTIFSLWYYQHVEGQRSDLILIDANLLAFDWYRERLANQYPTIDGLDMDDAVRLRNLNEGKRPFCMATLDPESSRLLECQ